MSASTRIVRDEAVTSQLGDADRFAGRVWLNELLPSRLFRVHFEPRARTHWHAHPRGQVLYILAGRGRVGGATGSVMTVGQGDAVFTEPGELHWHGAEPDCFMVHLAFSDGGDTAWTNPVSDEQYELAQEDPAR